MTSAHFELFLCRAGSAGGGDLNMDVGSGHHPSSSCYFSLQHVPSPACPLPLPALLLLPSLYLPAPNHCRALLKWTSHPSLAHTCIRTHYFTHTERACSLCVVMPCLWPCLCHAGWVCGLIRRWRRWRNRQGSACAGSSPFLFSLFHASLPLPGWNRNRQEQFRQNSVCV